jgi:hypothetical protein
MDAQVKAKWVAALRSGEYSQGESALKKDGKFCCLGVLCDTIDPSGWSEPEKTGYTRYTFEGSSDECWLPGTLEEKLGLRSKTGPLMAMNDYDKKSFAEIADYIEQNL